MTEKEIGKILKRWCLRGGSRDLPVRRTTPADSLRALLKHCLETKSMVEANLRRCEKIIAEVNQMLRGAK